MRTGDWFFTGYGSAIIVQSLDHGGPHSFFALQTKAFETFLKLRGYKPAGLHFNAGSNEACSLSFKVVFNRESSRHQHLIFKWPR